jgi:hypothetical protein
MNNARRKRLAEAEVMIGQAKSIIEECASEEREYYDSITELDEAVSALDDIETVLASAQE